MLGEMYDSWENGDAITDGGDPDGVVLGHALDLSEEQDNRILALLKRHGSTHAGPTHAELKSRADLAERSLAELREIRDVQSRTMDGLVTALAEARARIEKLEAVERAAREYSAVADGPYHGGQGICCRAWYDDMMDKATEPNPSHDDSCPVTLKRALDAALGGS